MINDNTKNLLLFFYYVSLIFVILMELIITKKINYLNITKVLSRNFNDFARDDEYKTIERKFIDPHDSSATHSLSSVEFKRTNINSNVYGIVYPVDEKIFDKLGYTRKLLPYKRTDVIYVPEISKDSVKCDVWAVKDKTRNVNDFVECDVGRGADACFKCIESRKYVRTCINIRKSFTVSDRNGNVFEIPANKNSTKGWCLPDNFKNLHYDGDNAVPENIDRNCNPNTGNWLLTQLGESEDYDSSYNWVCKCRYPNLMTNVSNLLSDCMKPVGCLPYGELDDITKKGLVNPYTNGRCVCPVTHKPDFDKTIGPVCVAKNIRDLDSLVDLYNYYGLSYGSELSLQYISPKFLSLFRPEVRDKLKLPNPCQVDMITGLKIPEESCKLVRVTITDNGSRKDIVFCQSVVTDYIAIKAEKDYLLNNNGRYPNACVKFYNLAASNRLVVEDGLYYPTIDANGHGRPVIYTNPLEYLGILSYYNNKRQPDVGLPIVKHAINTPIIDKFNIIKQTENYKNFIKEKLSPQKDGKWSRWPINWYNLDQIFKNTDDKLILYEDHPDIILWSAAPRPNDVNKYKTFLQDRVFVAYYALEVQILLDTIVPDMLWRKLHWTSGLFEQNSHFAWYQIPFYEYNHPQSGTYDGNIFSKYPEDRPAIYNLPVSKALKTEFPFPIVDGDIIRYLWMDYPSEWGLFEQDRTFPAEIRKTFKKYYDIPERYDEWISEHWLPYTFPATYLNDHLPVVVNPRYHRFDGTLFFAGTTKRIMFGSNGYVSNAFNIQNKASKFPLYKLK